MKEHGDILEVLISDAYQMNMWYREKMFDKLINMLIGFSLLFIPIAFIFKLVKKGRGR